MEIIPPTFRVGGVFDTSIWSKQFARIIAGTIIPRSPRIFITIHPGCNLTRDHLVIVDRDQIAESLRRVSTTQRRSVEIVNIAPLSTKIGLLDAVEGLIIESLGLWLEHN